MALSALLACLLLLGPRAPSFAGQYSQQTYTLRGTVVDSATGEPVHRALVQIFVHRRNQGQSFALTGLTKQSTAVLQVAGLFKLLPIHASVEEALAQRA